MGTRRDGPRCRAAKGLKMQQWQSIDEFLHMGGYGLYVWGSYGVTLVVLAAEVWLARARHRRARADLQQEMHP